jgi:hypothetical protein
MSSLPKGFQREGWSGLLFTGLCKQKKIEGFCSAYFLKWKWKEVIVVPA